MTDPAPLRTLSTRHIYTNAWISVREDQVEFPDGHTGIYGVVTTAPSVGVLPVHDDGSVVLVRQWRYVAGRATWEMPTGAAHPGESAEDAAQRELAEEAGLRAGHLRVLGSFATSKSILDETAQVFLATVLEPGRPTATDPTEFLHVASFAFDDVLTMVLDGEIVDAMTIVAVLLADRLRRC